jgi:erythromycin esterase
MLVSSSSSPAHATLDEWIAREATLFPVDASDSFKAALDQVIVSLGEAVELLGFGEALHGGEEILLLRNRIFQRLVEAHGYRAIAIESSFPRGRVANEYVAGRGPARYEEVQETGFNHGFGKLDANRELVEWMRHYNADPAHEVKLRFHGFDIPGLTGGIASPSQVLHFVLDYLGAMDLSRGPEQRQRIEALLGADFDWENPAMYADPTKSMGLTPAANALRIETEDLITELRTRRPELIARGGEDRFLEALQHATVARELLNFHAAMARKSDPAGLLGIRDALMADNLVDLVGRERGRGKVLVFAHNSHLQRGKAALPWAARWPAGAHLQQMLGSRYAVIGSAVGVSEGNGIGEPEAGPLEARLMARAGSAWFIPTHRGQGLPAAEVASLPVRSGSKRNPTYIPLSSQSLTDFDYLAVLRSTTYNRGGREI